MTFKIKNTGLFTCSHTKDNSTCIVSSKCNIKCKENKVEDRLVNITIKKK